MDRLSAKSAASAAAEALVMACVRPPSILCVQTVADLALAVTDWEMVLSAAERCRALPLLAFRLTQAGVMWRLPETASRRLQGAALQSEARTLWLLNTLERALMACAHRGVQPIVLKGAANAAIFESPGLRPIGDLDLLFHPQDISGACESLASIGLVRVRADETRQITFGQDRPRLYVDVHHTLDLAGRYRIDHSELWNESRPYRFGAAEARVLSPTHSLAHAVLHAVIHRLESLHPLVDAAWLADRFGSAVDWDRLPILGHRWMCREALFYGLTAGRRLVGLNCPPDVVRGLRPRRWRRTVSGRLWPGQDPLVGASGDGRRGRLFSLLAITYPWGLVGVAGRRLRAVRKGGGHHPRRRRTAPG